MVLLARVATTAGPSAPLDPGARSRSAPLGAARPDSIRLSASPRDSARRGQRAASRARQTERTRLARGGRREAGSRRASKPPPARESEQGRRYPRARVLERITNGPPIFECRRANCNIRRIERELDKWLKLPPSRTAFYGNKMYISSDESTIHQPPNGEAIFFNGFLILQLRRRWKEIALVSIIRSSYLSGD